jgi:hypothetical protein
MAKGPIDEHTASSVFWIACAGCVAFALCSFIFVLR